MARIRNKVNPKIRKQVILRDGKCVICGRAITRLIEDDPNWNKRWRPYDSEDRPFHFDHIIPLVAGGTDDVNNIQLTCQLCNLAKSRRERTKRAYEGGKAMNHSIKVSEETYQELLKLQRPRETFSEIVERLLVVQSKLRELANIIEGQAAYAEWKLKQIRETPPT